MKIKEFAIIPTEHYDRQQIRISGDKVHKEVWLNPSSSRETNSVCMSPEEAIMLAKLIYKAAYAAGYEIE